MQREKERERGNKRKRTKRAGRKRYSKKVAGRYRMRHSIRRERDDSVREPTKNQLTIRSTSRYRHVTTKREKKREKKEGERLDTEESEGRRGKGKVMTYFLKNTTKRPLKHLNIF